MQSAKRPPGRDAGAARAFNRGGRDALVVPADYLEVVVTTTF
jgi:hypothetical protein